MELQLNLKIIYSCFCFNCKNHNVFYSLLLHLSHLFFFFVFGFSCIGHFLKSVNWLLSYQTVGLGAKFSWFSI